MKNSATASGTRLLSIKTWYQWLLCRCRHISCTNSQFLRTRFGLVIISAKWPKAAAHQRKNPLIPLWKIKGLSLPWQSQRWSNQCLPAKRRDILYRLFRFPGPPPVTIIFTTIRITLLRHMLRVNPSLGIPGSGLAGLCPNNISFHKF